MLKIKDNVDLEELEKLGFEHKEYEDMYYDFYIKNNVRIDFSDRIINHYDNLEDIDLNEYLDVVYDLIKADLVEKVDD